MDRTRLRQIIKEELNKTLKEAMGSGSSFLVNEFIYLNGGIEALRSAYLAPSLGGEDMEANIRADLKAVMKREGYSATPMEIADAAIDIARMIGARRKAIPKSHYERDIEDPYGPEYGFGDDY